MHVQEFERRPKAVGMVRKDADLKLASARMWEGAKPWITAEERAEAEKRVRVHAPANIRPLSALACRMLVTGFQTPGVLCSTYVVTAPS